MTTIETLTNAQIRALRTEAATAGDDAQVALCDSALDGDDSARAHCAKAIAAAEAQAD